MRALMEGKSKVQGNFLTSLYWEGNAASKNNTYLPVEVVLPIHMSGILSGKKVFPCTVFWLGNVGVEVPYSFSTNISVDLCKIKTV